MTNAKELKTENAKTSKSKKAVAKAAWKKVGKATDCVSALNDVVKERRRSLKSYGTVVHIPAKKGRAPEAEDVTENSSKLGKDKANEAEKKAENTAEGKVEKLSEKPEKRRKSSNASSTKQPETLAETLKEKLEPPQPDEDSSTLLKNSICQSIKNAFSLAYGDDEQLKITVDNIYPLIKSLGLNPQSERVVDLVREASVETFGDINVTDCENVLLGMVKEIDETLWKKRMEEKERLHREREAVKAIAEAERLRLERERVKAGFEKEEEDSDEWGEYEQKLKDEAEKKKKEEKEDELYDNLRMAFRFIDADEDGVISTQDLYILMMGLGEMLTDDDLFGMLNTADIDCDGKVTFEDFKNFLVPQSGDESLILSPAALAKQLLQANQITTCNSTEANPETNTDNETEKVTDNSENTQETVVNTAPENEQKAEAEKAPELSAEEKARLQRRRQSMLWGYMTVAKSTTDSRLSLPSHMR